MIRCVEQRTATVSGRQSVAGAGFGHLHVQALTPLRQLTMEFVPHLGMLVGDILLFRFVRGQVVQFEPAILEKFDQLPVAATNGTAGPAALIAVMRKVPV